MAKVKSPLFSMGASGQLGKSLVYMTWKGIDDVRSHVVPANPRSTGQTTQRGYFTTAVSKWHTIAFNALDKAGFDLWAAQEALPMSGFNKFAKSVVNALVAAKAWGNLYAVVISSIVTTGFAVAATGVSTKTYTLKCGLTPSTMNTVFAVTNTAGALAASTTGLVLGTTYYFQISNTTVNELDRTGIYKQKTAAA